MLTITNEDNMELMSRYEDNYFDLAIVDPPYGIDAARMTMGKGSGNDKGTHKKKNWDNETPTPEYFNELKRVSKNQIIWGVIILIYHLVDVGFYGIKKIIILILLVMKWHGLHSTEWLNVTGGQGLQVGILKTKFILLKNLFYYTSIAL